jgi:hypothetical protein
MAFKEVAKMAANQGETGPDGVRKSQVCHPACGDAVTTLKAG